MSRLRRSALSSVSVSLLLMLLGLFTGVAAARILGPEQRGFLGIIVFWTQLLANAFRLPFSEGLLVYCRHAGGDDRKNLAWSAARAAEQIAMILAICAVPVAAGILYLVASRQDLPHFGLAVALLVLTLFSRTQNEVFMGLLYVERRFDLINVSRIVVPATYGAGVTIIVIGGYGIEGFLVAQCVSMIAIFLFRLYHYPKRPEVTRVLDAPRSIFGVAVSLQWLTLVTLVTKQIDKLLLFSFAPVAFVGHYIVAFTLLTPTQSIINTALSTIGLPAFASLAPDNRAGAARRMLRAATSASTLTTAAVALVALPVVPIIFGSAYTEAAWITVVLSLAIMLQPVRTAASQILKALGQVRMILFSELVFAVCFATCYFALSGNDLLWRVAAGFLLANLCGLAVLATALRACLPDLRTRDWIWPTRQSILEVVTLVLPTRWHR